jgi:hypothetical protein
VYCTLSLLRYICFSHFCYYNEIVTVVYKVLVNVDQVFLCFENVYISLRGSLFLVCLAIDHMQL